MKILMPLIAVVLLLSPVGLVIACVHKHQRSNGPDTPQKFDSQGNPNFGPKKMPASRP